MILIMFAYKATSYEKMQKPKQEKKFKQNSYEEIRKLVENNEDTKDIVNEVKKKGKSKSENNIKFNIFD